MKPDDRQQLLDAKTKPDDRQRLMVIGSGWAGLYIAENINTKLYAVTIISPRRTSAYTPLLASAACGLFPFSCSEGSIRAKGRDCNFIKANALGVDFENKQVLCEPAFDEDPELKSQSFNVPYDKLIICPGCQTNTFNTPGVAENAIFMKHVSDAMALRKRLFDQLEKANLPGVTDEQAAALLHVAIVGGGPTEITNQGLIFAPYYSSALGAKFGAFTQGVKRYLDVVGRGPGNGINTQKWNGLSSYGTWLGG